MTRRLTISHSLPDVFNFFQKSGHEAVVDPCLDEQPCPGNTRLPGCDEAGERCTVDSGFNVCVVENDDWSLVFLEYSLQLIQVLTFPPNSAVYATRFDPTILPNARPVFVPAWYESVAKSQSNGEKGLL